jgi:hypothetical protein
MVTKKHIYDMVVVVEDWKIENEKNEVKKECGGKEKMGLKKKSAERWCWCW